MRLSVSRRLFAVVFLFLSIAGFASAQELQPGEAYLTRFSGTIVEDGRTLIDPNGTVGSIADIRNPGQPPQGQHWASEPQRLPVTAGQAGQVFGIALDDATPPNIYLTATAAFGLHRTTDNSDWMTGMWGPGGGPGTVWKLSADNNYTPEIFAEITLDGRTNTAASLGNIAYDRWNKQLYVSDMETGMIHRLSISDGSDLGRHDHGSDGRANFLDTASGTTQSLAPVTFNPATSARIADCAFGDFASTPACWNYADFRRRVWGLGVRRDNTTGEVRLFYATWGSQGFGHPDWFAAGDDQKNTVWSVAIASDGSFDTASVRREFVLPDMFTDPADIARAGPSHPVADLAFPKCAENNILIVAERGGVRNLGLDAEAPFAYPNESRAIRYRLDDAGVWQPDGRYDVGHYQRTADPLIRANASGGVDTGPGFTAEQTADTNAPDQTVWMTGDQLCSPDGPCFDPATGNHSDTAQVHGAQGTPEGQTTEITPPAPVPADGPNASWMIDADANGDPALNDATKIGDVEIYQPCGPGVSGEVTPQPGPGPEPGPDPVPPEDCPFDLSIEKTGPEECPEGGECEFTIVVTNNGPEAYTGPVFLQDASDVDVVLLEVLSPEWTCQMVEGAINCYHPSVTLEPGETLTLRIRVRLPAEIDGETWMNCIRIVWPLAEDQNEHQINLWVEQALFFEGYLDAAEVDGIFNAATEAAIRNFQTDRGLEVTGTITEELRRALFPSVAGLPGDCVPENDRDCHTVRVPQERFDLQMHKEGPAECQAGDECTYQLSIRNNSPVEYTGRPSVVDDVPDGAVYVGNTGPWTCEQPGGAGGDITCRRNADVTMPPATEIGFNLTIRLPAEIEGEAVANGVCINWPAMAESSDDVPPNDCTQVITPIAQPFELAMNKTAPDGCEPGGECTFELEVTNNGPGIFEGTLAVSDVLIAPPPPGMGILPADLVRSEPPEWACEVVGTTVRCTREGVRLERGDSISVRVTVRIPEGYDREQVRDCASIHWESMDVREDPPVLENDQDCENTPITRPRADLGIVKDGPAQCQPAGSCQLTVTVTNHGPDTFTDRISVSDSLPEGMTLNSQSAPWTCISPDATNYVCNHPEITLEPTGSVTLTLDTNIGGGVLGRIENCAEINWAGMDASGTAEDGNNPANDRDCHELDTVELMHGQFDISLSTLALGACQLGAQCNIAIAINNVGAEPFVGELGIQGGLSPVAPISSVQAMNPGWVCRTTGSGTYECRHNPITLEPGNQQSFRLGVAIPGNFAARAITHGVKLMWIGGNPDKNPVNDKDSVTIPLKKPATQPLPPPPAADCDRGWKRFSARNQVPSGWARRPLRQGSKTIAWCGRPKPRCPQNWKQFGNRGEVPKGWLVRPLRDAQGRTVAWCAQRKPRCAKPWRQYGNVGDIPSGWDRKALRDSTGRTIAWCARKPQRACTGCWKRDPKTGRCNVCTRRCVGGTLDKRTCTCSCPASRPNKTNPAACVTACKPGDAGIVCIGGKVSGNRCHCRAGWKQQRLGPRRFRCLQPPRIKCSRGKVVKGQCICPRGWTRRTISRNVYQCVKRSVRIKCSRGKVVRGKCICPRGWRRRTLGRNIYRCIKPAGASGSRRVVCSGGKVSRGRCFCPRGTVRRRIGRRAFRCVKRR